MKKGQGLLETIVALGIIMTGLMSTITLVISNLRAQRDSASRLIAVNLAREGIEVVRAIRDTNWLAGRDAWAGITDVGASTVIPVFNSTTSGITLAPASPEGVQATVYLEPDTGLYMQRLSADFFSTRYRRFLTINTINCVSQETGLNESTCRTLGLPLNVGATIRSQVQWQEGGQTKNVEIIEKLYDWR